MITLTYCINCTSKVDKDIRYNTRYCTAHHNKILKRKLRDEDERD